MTRGVGLALSLVAAVLAAAGGWAVGGRDLTTPRPPGDRVLAVVEGLRESPVHVDPDSVGLLTEQEHDRLAARAASSNPPVFVTVWDQTSEGGFYLPSAGLEQIAAELGEPGLYVSVARRTVTVRDIGIDGDHVSAPTVDLDRPLTPETMSAAISTILDENDGRDFSEASNSGSDYWGGTGGMIAAGLLIGSLAGGALALVVTIVWFTVRSRRSRA